MFFTDLQHGAEKAVLFTLIGMVINSHFSLKQPILKTATIIAGASWLFHQDTDNQGALVALSFTGSIHLIHETFFGSTIGDDYYE